MPKNIGKWFEEQMHRKLNALQVNHGLYYHRLKDSHSARRLVGNAPADWLVAFRGQAQLWEAKASESHPSLRACLASMVGDGQVGHHTLWHHNGCASWFIFYSDLTGEIEVWNGETVVYARSEGVPLPKNEEHLRCSPSLFVALAPRLFKDPA